MSTMLVDLDRLTPEQMAALAPALRDAMRDKSYELLPLGEDVAAYMAAKRQRQAGNTQKTYESSLDKLVRHFPDLRVEDFEPPVGTERLLEYLDTHWGGSAPATYNVHRAVLASFFGFWQIRGRLKGDPTRAIEKARKKQTYRATFSKDQREAMLANAANRRDRIALRLLFDYGLRRGALKVVRFKHFDHQRRRLTIFTKGSKVRTVPLPDPDLWLELERLIQDWDAGPDDMLMCRERVMPRAGLRRYPTEEVSSTTIHRWFYRRLAAAGLVDEGQFGSNREMNLHAARHTAAQRVFDRTGNVAAVQSLLGHASIATTEQYFDVSEEALAAALAKVLEDEREGRS